MTSAVYCRDSTLALLRMIINYYLYFITYPLKCDCCRERPMTSDTASSQPAANGPYNTPISDTPTSAGAEHPVQLIPKAGQVGNFSIDFAELHLDQIVDIRTWIVVMVGQGEQFAHLRHAKAEFARAPHKSERRQMFVRVIAVIAIGSVGSWKDALALVIADGFRLSAGCPSQFADTHCLTL